MLWLIILAFAALYYYLRERMRHFEKLGVPHRKPAIIFGNMASVLFQRKCFADLISECYEEFKGERYFGFYDFMTPQIIIRDPELIKDIGIKYFNSFVNHKSFVIPEVDKMFSDSVFLSRDDEWRETRALLSPAFTTSKMKGMFNLVNETAKDFNDCLTANSNMNKEIDIKDFLGRYTTDIIGNAAFGLEINSLKNRNNDFYIIGKDSVNFNGYKTLIIFLNRLCPFVMKYLGIKVFPEKAERFFRQVVESTVETREKEGIVRPDMLHLMMQANKDSKTAKLSMDSMTAQAFIFFFGGYDTVSTASCFATHELAHNPSIQKKLIKEIRENYNSINNKENGYDAVKGLSYLEAVVRETLRLYTPAFLLDRVCNETFNLPAAHPGGNEVTVRPGDLIGFPFLAIQRDPKYYSQPKKFMPERFLRQEDETISREMLDAPHYLPFGLGPRFCLGNRFALMGMRLVLFHLLAKCEVIPSKKTEYPIKFSKDSFLLTAENGFWLKLKTHETE